jgi:hypothetical protein
MALSGTLQDFGAAEALGLVAREEKSGRMHLVLPSGSYSLYFNKGRVVQARAGRPSVDDSFFPMLRELHVVPKQGWREVTVWQESNPNDDPVQFFISQGYADREDFEGWLILHTQGVLDEVLEASEGSFDFETTIPDSYAVPLTEQVEFMIMEAGRRVDESTEMLARELQASSVPSIRPGGRPAPNDLVQAAVLRKIDGEMNVQQILDTTPIPKYDTLAQLRLLVQEGAVVLRISGNEDAPKKSRTSASEAATQVGVFVAAAGLAFASAAIGFLLWGLEVPFLP